MNRRILRCVVLALAAVAWGMMGCKSEEKQEAEETRQVEASSYDLETSVSISAEEARAGRDMTLEYVRRGWQGPGSPKEETVVVTVRIPPGVRDGQIVRVKGMGEAAGFGCDRGDLHIHVRVEPEAPRLSTAPSQGSQ